MSEKEITSRKHLSLTEKLAVISYFNRTKCSIRKLAKHFNIGKTQAGQLIKKQDKFLELWLSNSDNRNGSLRPNSIGFQIDKYVYQWYLDTKNENIAVSGPMIQIKALEIAKELGNEEFKASNGWLERFRIRHNINPKPSTKQEKEAKSSFDEWKKRLDVIHSTYPVENIFSAVATGLFFQAVPENTSCLITETCSNGKLADKRFTILFCICMDGNKEKPLVIAKPLKNKPDEGWDFNQFQVDCEFDSMAWMTRNIMTKWLKDFDKRMKGEKRNVVLFLSSAFSHYEPQLTNIKIVYFPPCLFLENQTPNHAVIQNFKIIYRQLLLKRLIELKESDEKETTASKFIISHSQGLTWVETAWKELSECVIHRCFEEIGFTSVVPSTVSDNEAFLNDVSNLLCAYDSDVNAINYVSIDADLMTAVAEADDPEFIEVLVDGNEMRDILTQEDEEAKESKNVLAILPCSEGMDLTCLENNETSITSYSEALRNLKDLELFYLSQSDSTAALLVNQLIAHSENAVYVQ